MSDDRNIEEIRLDIEQNRDDMSQTIDQIEDRLRPDALQAQVMEIVRQATDQLLSEFDTKADGITAKINDEVQSAIQRVAVAKSEELFANVDGIVRRAGKTIWEHTSNNPAPVALMATAIGLLASERPDGQSGSQSGILGQVMSGLGGQLSDVKEGVASLTGQAGSGITSTAGDARAGVSGLAQKAPAPGTIWEGQPLAIGLLATGLGFLAALAAPQSQREREAMSPIVDAAQTRLDQMGITDSTGQGTGGMVGQMKQAGGELLDEAKRAAADTLAQAGEAASSIGQTVTKSAGSPSNSSANR